MIEAELVEKGGVEVVDGDGVGGDREAEVVGSADGGRGADSSAGEPDGVALGEVVAFAAVIGHALFMEGEELGTEGAVAGYIGGRAEGDQRGVGDLEVGRGGVGREVGAVLVEVIDEGRELFILLLS